MATTSDRIKAGRVGRYDPDGTFPFVEPVAGGWTPGMCTGPADVVLYRWQAVKYIEKLHEAARALDKAGSKALAIGLRHSANELREELYAAELRERLSLQGE